MPTRPSASATAPSLPAQHRRRWPLVALLSWCAAGGAIVHVLLALLWRDDLAEASGAILVGHYLAFMARVFLFHAGVAMLLVIAFAMLTRRVRLGIVAAMPALVVGVPLAPSLLRGVAPPSTQVASSDELCVLSINTMYGQADPAGVDLLVKAHRPDVIVIQEWTMAARRSYLPMLEAEYPHLSEVVREDALGQAVLSRRAFTEPPRLYPPLANMREPQITAGVLVAGRPMRVTNTHLLPPIGLRYFADQRAGARSLAAWARSSDASRPHVLIGDFNAPPGTAILNAFIDDGWSEAHHAAGFARGSTWPSVGVLRHLPGIRLDNAIIGPGVVVTDARVGQPIGSDHRPIVVRVRWAE